MEASLPHSDKARLFVVMGVAGSGKSSVGADAAALVGGTYIDGDDFHPQTNINKMSAGTPLTDEDRWPWLKIVGSELAKLNGIGLIGCSALKRLYRKTIAQAAGEPVVFLYLDGSRELIAKRMAAREGHFMPTSLLDSQFKTLEPPSVEEPAVWIDIEGSQADVAAAMAAEIKRINQ